MILMATRIQSQKTPQEHPNQETKIPMTTRLQSQEATMEPPNQETEMIPMETHLQSQKTSLEHPNREMEIPMTTRLQSQETTQEHPNQVTQLIPMTIRWLQKDATDFQEQPALNATFLLSWRRQLRKVIASRFHPLMQRRRRVKVLLFHNFMLEGLEIPLRWPQVPAA